jgi:hypothetical protein
MNKKRGFSTLLALLLLLLIVGAVTYLYTQTNTFVSKETNGVIEENKNTSTTSTSNETVNEKNGVETEVKEDISIDQEKLYKDEEYGFQFSYPAYMNIEVFTVENPGMFGRVNQSSDVDDLKNIDVSMATLSGSGTLIKVRVVNTRESWVLNNQANTEKVVFGNGQATRLDWGVAGGDFVTFEIPLKNKYYLYIETDRDFADNDLEDLKSTFSDNLGIINSFIKASEGFAKIKTSFKIFQ